jgi:prevent-host-death family protein
MAEAHYRMAASKAREKLAEIVNEVAFGGKRLRLQRHGKDVVAVISIEDLELLEELEDRYDGELVDAALAEGGPTIPWRQLQAELGLPPKKPSPRSR